MPPKKKAPPLVSHEDKYIDVLSYLELVGDCLDRADTSAQACLEGILKADIALGRSQGDADLQYIIVIKRAELLYIAANNRYNTDELSDNYRNPLDSCIMDCEKVIKNVSSADPVSKGLHETATKLCEKAYQLRKNTLHEPKSRRNHSGKRANDEKKGLGSVFQRYNPTKTVFKHITKINPYLLQDVVDCYRHSKTVCRLCFYKTKRQEPIGSNHHCKCCRRPPHPLVIMPASKMCQNLTESKVLPIPSPPKMLLTKNNKHKSFQICRNRDHTSCSEKSAAGDTWFAHSIEELVIWTVERHYNCKFSDYIEERHQDTDRPNYNLFDQDAWPTGQMHNHGSRSDDEEEDSNDMDDLYSDSLSDDLCRDGVDEEDGFDFYPEDCKFPEITSIPDCLLINIIECYRDFKEYCKWCYYKQNKKGIVTVDRRTNCTVCMICRHEWTSIVVIPASEMCWNFADFEHLPIAPWPTGKPNNDPFEYCKKKDHFRCFRVYVESEFWYPHTVEEMVIWTVERERKCTFSQFIDTLSQIPTEITPNYSQFPALSTTTASIQQPQAKHEALPTTSNGSYATASKGSNSSQPQQTANLSNGHIATSATTKTQSGYYLQGVIVSPSDGSTVNNFETDWPTPIGNQLREFPQIGAVNLRPHPAVGVSPSASTNKQQVNFTRDSGGTLTSLVSDFSTGNFSKSLFSPQKTATTNSPLKVAPIYDAVSIATCDSGGGGGGDTTSLQHLINSSSLPGGFPPIEGTNKTMADDYINSGPPGIGSARVHGRKNYRVAPIQNTVEVQALSHMPILVTRVEEVTPTVFKFSEVNFKNLSDIPFSLLKSVALCFQDKMTVCRICFYGERSISEKFDGGEELCSTGEHKWHRPIKVIPGCELCDNEPSFQKGEHVPIPPLPPVAIIKKCENTNHHKCFAKSLEKNDRYAHSIEELVVWIVESEKDCSFEQFIVHELHAAITNGVSSPLKSNIPVPLPITTTTILPNNGTSGVMSNTIATNKPMKVSPLLGSSTSAPSSKSPPHQNVGSPNGGKYKPKDTEFVHIKDIPVDLLLAVAECYAQCRMVCRVCFFDSNCTILADKREVNNVWMCEKGHSPWKPIKVIPHCRMCVGPSDYVPLPPLPKHMKASNIPFAVCKKSEHQTCYAMSKGTNPWFPHTVEELVIWTVERETCSLFAEVYERYLPQHKSVTSVNRGIMVAATNKPTTTQKSTVSVEGMVSEKESPPSTTSTTITKFDVSNGFLPGTDFSVPHLPAGFNSRSSQAGPDNQSAPFGTHTGSSVFSDYMMSGITSGRQYGHQFPIGPPGMMDGDPKIATEDSLLKYFPALLNSTTEPSGSDRAESFGPKNIGAGTSTGINGLSLGLTQETALRNWNSAAVNEEQSALAKTSLNGTSSANMILDPRWSGGLAVGGQQKQNKERNPQEVNQHTKLPPGFTAANKPLKFTSGITGNNASLPLNPGDKVASSESGSAVYRGTFTKDFKEFIPSFPVDFHSMNVTKQANDNGNGARAAFGGNWSVNSNIFTPVSESYSYINNNNSSNSSLSNAGPISKDSETVTSTSSTNGIAGSGNKKTKNGVNVGSESRVADVSNGKESKSARPPIKGSSQLVNLDSMGTGKGNPSKSENVGSKRDSLPSEKSDYFSIGGTSPSLPRSRQEPIGSKSKIANPSTRQAVTLLPPNFASKGDSVYLNYNGVLGKEPGGIAPSSGGASLLQIATQASKHNTDSTSNDSNFLADNTWDVVSADIDVELNSESSVLANAMSSRNKGGHSFAMSTLREGLSESENPLPSHGFRNRSASPRAAAIGDKRAPKVEKIVPAFACLLCYEGFSVSEQFIEHCNTDARHMELVIRDSGSKVAWKFPPPPPNGNVPKDICDSGSTCPGSPLCQLPHSEAELVEWRLRWQYRNKKKTGSKYVMSSDEITNDRFGTGLLLSEQNHSQYGGLQVKISDGAGDSSHFKWTVTIQGQNWQNLFGIYCYSRSGSGGDSSETTFMIDCIEGDTLKSPLKPQASLWTVSSSQQRHCPVLLGKVIVTVTAALAGSKKGLRAGSGKLENEVRFDLGSKEYVYVKLECDLKDLSTVSDSSTVNGNQSVHKPMLMPEQESPIGVATIQQQPFVPKTKWNLSSQSSSSSDELGVPNIEGEDLMLQHVPIEDWGCSLTDESYWKN